MSIVNSTLVVTRIVGALPTLPTRPPRSYACRVGDLRLDCHVDKYRTGRLYAVAAIVAGVASVALPGSVSIQGNPLTSARLLCDDARLAFEAFVAEVDRMEVEWLEAQG